jgi:hypothetical protein
LHARKLDKAPKGLKPDNLLRLRCVHEKDSRDTPTKGALPRVVSFPLFRRPAYGPHVSRAWLG